jgi:TRAP-type C4-dicarboxylate transport system permease small subunit
MLLYIDGGLAILLGSLVGTLTFGVILSVVLRYFFGISFAWAEELLTIVFIATTFFGAALGLREKEHIAINLVPESAPPAIKKAMAIIICAAIIIVSIFIFRYSTAWIARVGKVPSPATGISNGTFYTIVPISFGITIFYAIVQILSEFMPIDPPRTRSTFDGSEVAPVEKGIHP